MERVMEPSPDREINLTIFDARVRRVGLVLKVLQLPLTDRLAEVNWSIVDCRRQR
jgi:hypothetical protein